MDWGPVFLKQQVIWEYPGYGIHAEYTLSNKHSDFYFNSDALNLQPLLFEKVCQALFARIKDKILETPDWVLTYPPFGLALGKRLAELFECKFNYIKSLDNPIPLMPIEVDETVLICADDLYSGGSVLKLLQVITKAKAKTLEPLVVVGNFYGQDLFEGYKVISLLQKTINLWDPNACPLCLDGSEAVPARINWQKLIPHKH